jgi:hypothetical protein
MTAVRNSGTCHHCRLPGHWADKCPLLIRACTYQEHVARLEEYKQRFLSLEITLAEKQDLIQTENDLWNNKMKVKVK